MPKAFEKSLATTKGWRVLGSEVLEIAIGVVFVFLIVSLIATTLRETIESVLRTRAIHLERGIRQLLDDPSGTDVTKTLFDHPLIYGLFAGGYRPDRLVGYKNLFKKSVPRTAMDGPSRPVRPIRVPFFSRLPNYIPSRNVALALLDVASGGGAPGAGAPLNLESVRATALTLQNGRLRQALLVAIGEAEGDLDRARTSLEAWFDSGMDRVSGWYKRETQWILLALGLVLAGLLNVDAIDVVRALATDNTTRQTLIANVEKARPGLNADGVSEAELKQRVDGLSDLIGWPHFRQEVDEEMLTSLPAIARLPESQREPVARQMIYQRALGARAVQSLSADQRSSAAIALMPVAAQELLERQALAAPRMAALSPAQRSTAVRKQIDADQNATWWRHLPGRLPGWLITALAVSLGAPFWFDLLNKLMVIRSTVKPFEKSPAEGSEDRKGARPSADMLAPRPGGPNNNNSGSNNVIGPSGTPPPPAPVTLRLAVDMKDLDPGSIKLAHDETVVPVPDDGLVEVPLSIGIANQLVVRGTKSERPVSWNTTLTPDRDDEGQPMLAELA